MRVYLVGGAVRDELLKRPVTDHDYVVVGATPELMLDAGYKPIGKDFPVFLHPKSKEEYALARTERKSGRGYHGFTFNASPDVTLEEDLQRRDLTINAIARSDDGNIVDPYGGRDDITARKLRHVSASFAEDPVRVLRVARFLARYAPIGFSIADETMDLMRGMSAAGELDYLVPERIWAEFEKALNEPEPWRFIETLRECGGLAKILPEVDALFGIPQNPEYHPEIDTGVHTIMVLKQAVKMTKDSEVRFAALLHDVGKATTEEGALPHHPDHHKRSPAIIKALASRLRLPVAYKDLAMLVAEHHTACHRADCADAPALLDLMLKLDGMRRPARFERFLQACEADSRGRLGFENKTYPQADLLRKLLRAWNNIDVQAIVSKVEDPANIKDAILEAKLKAIEHTLANA